MKIRTQFIAAFVVFIILLFFLSGFVISTNQQVDSLSHQQDIANSIAIETGELGYLSNDYILHREPQLADRWNVKYTSISSDIAHLSVDKPEQQAIVDSLAANLRNTKLVFDDIASSSLDDRANNGFVELSWSRIAVQNQGMIFDASRLATLFHNEENDVRAMRLYFTFALMGAFGALLFAGYFFVYRRMLRSLGDIQEGALVVGEGNFNQRLSESSDDEIGDLSRSFNRMTAKLREVTASKADLEREMSGRKMAEERLIRKNEDLNALNEELIATQEEVQREKDRLSSLINSISDEVWFADTRKKFTLANPAALREFALGIDPVDIEKFASSLEVYRPDGTPRPVEEAPPLRALKGEEVRNFEEMVRTPETGVVRYRQVSSNPVRDASGTIIGAVSVVRDISERVRAEEELKKKNIDLNALNEELTAIQEELEQNVDDLNRNEEVLRQNEERLKQALAEKEVLLSEIHHRVKNNLTAFISLLSLDGSIEETAAGKQLKVDLQNRARSMALVHETLYRTHLYNDVDMGMYLTTLLDQIGNSIQTPRAVKTVVDAQGVMLDIPRATPAGLMINELVTNSFKYAFPVSFDVEAVRCAPPTLSVSLTRKDGMYEMIVSDNGVGLPPVFDLTKTQTLGLKLVNFLAKHQLRANVEVNSENGTEFRFRFRE